MATRIRAASGSLVIPGTNLLHSAEYSRDGDDLVLTWPDGTTVRVEGHFALPEPPTLLSEQGEVATPSFVMNQIMGPPLEAAAGPVVLSSGSSVSGQDTLDAETLDTEVSSADLDSIETVGPASVPSDGLAGLVLEGDDLPDAAVDLARLNPINDAPVLLTNSLTVTEGETVILDTDVLQATDAETEDAALVFTVSNLLSGQFELVAAPGAPIASFTQGQIAAGEVQFAHDGSDDAPSYVVTVSDGALTDSSAASIIFIEI